MCAGGGDACTEGSRAEKMDVKNAFRQIAVDPDGAEVFGCTCWGSNVSLITVAVWVTGQSAVVGGDFGYDTAWAT